MDNVTNTHTHTHYVGLVCLFLDLMKCTHSNCSASGEFRHVQLGRLQLRNVFFINAKVIKIKTCNIVKVAFYTRQVGLDK